MDLIILEVNQGLVLIFICCLDSLFNGACLSILFFIILTSLSNASLGLSSGIINELCKLALISS